MSRPGFGSHARVLGPTFRFVNHRLALRFVNHWNAYCMKIRPGRTPAP